VILPKKHYEISDGQLQKYWLQGLWLKIHHLSLDEPTTHLDLLHKVALFKLLKNSLKKRKNAFCFDP
jgi:iron complex transport system ATP-binding protein